MKKVKKIIFILFANVIILILLLFVCDFLIYSYYYKTYDNLYDKLKFKYLAKVNYLIDLKTYFNGSNNIYRGRKPDGLEYSENKPIVLFGCSFAHGQFLNYKQTLSYKLAHTLHRPVYNRAVPAHGIQQMYWQTSMPQFYVDVPPAKDVIFILIDDHYRRMHVHFMDILDHHFNIHYSKKHNDFVLDNTNNYLINILKSSYTFKFLNIKYSDYYVKSPKNAEKLTDEALWFFVKTRENLEKNWNEKFKFTVIILDEIKYKDILKKKLKDNNFNIVEISDLTNEDLSDSKYLAEETNHPKEEMWDLLTPLIIKGAGL